MLTYFILLFVLLRILMDKNLELLVLMGIVYGSVIMLGGNNEIAILLSIISVALNPQMRAYENFVDEKKEKMTNKKKEKMTNKKKEKMSNKKKEKMSNQGVIDLESELKENVRLDAGTTFLKAYESLDSSTIKNMQKDTVALIETQKTLMNTLSNMGPLLKNSEKLMKVFNSSFGKK